MAYVESTMGLKKKVFLGLFFGLLSIAVHLILLTFTKSVLIDAIPYLMQQSYFSTVSVYNKVSFYFYFIYYLIFYDYLSFTEIRKNRWYLLVKMGYNPQTMILTKLVAICYSILIIYSTGFATTIIMSAFLKYTPVLAYIPALYVSGLADLMVINIILTTASLFYKQKIIARYFGIFCFAVMLTLKDFLGCNSVVSNRVLMQNLLVLFDFKKSLYMPVCALLVLSCLVISFIKARDVAKYYSVPYHTYGYVLPENAVIIKRDHFSGRIQIVDDEEAAKRRSKIFDAAVNAVLICVVLAAFTFNAFVLILSTAQPGKEVTIFGVIPYIFVSNTMEPAISENDLAFFKRIDENEKIETGDIVLFKQENVVYVERVIAKDDSIITVDIDYYPSTSQEGSMKKEIDRGTIYGVFTGRSRWLGALILFANSIFGRIVLLFIPVMVLYFYKQIKVFIVKSSNDPDDE